MKRLIATALAALVTAGVLTACTYEPYEGLVVDKDKSTRTEMVRSGNVTVPRTRTVHKLMVQDASGEEEVMRVSSSAFRDCNAGDAIVRNESGEITCTG